MNKRVISLLLVLFILSSILISCADSKDGEEKNNTETTTTVSDNGNTTVDITSAETTGKYDVSDNLPADLNYGGDKITILSRGRSWTKDEVSVSSINGDLINDAVYNRNLAVEERLGVTIDNTMTDDTDAYTISNMIRTQVKAGTNDYDMFANSVYSTIMYTGEGLFRDLTESTTLDLSQKYWAQGFNEAASFGNSQYFATGAICLSTMRFIFATFFNRQLFNDMGLGMPYDTVRDGKWTLDKQYEYASLFYVDTNGDGAKDITDNFGFVTNADMIGVDSYWSSCDLPILRKTNDNTYEYAMNVDRLNTAVGKINRLIWENPGSFSVVHAGADSEQDTIAQKFSDGTAAMVTLRLIEAEGSFLRDMVNDYGVIPMPKLDENQEKYLSYAHDQFSAYCIPVTCNDDDRFDELGALLEALASESYRTVLPAYYEVTLKEKYCHDEDSLEMLDLITENFYIDAGVLYTKSINSVHQLMRTFIGSNLKSVTTMMKTNDKAVSKLLKTLQDGLLKFE